MVTGSVRRQGPRLRLSAQLTAADSRNELWAERFDRSTEDVFAATDELVRTIVGTLAGRVRAALAKRKPPANFAAYDFVLRAHVALTKIGDLGEEAEARRLFEQALACDPHYPRAHAGLAIVLLRDWYRGDNDAAIDRALNHAQQAVAFDSDDNECQETWAGSCCTGAPSISPSGTIAARSSSTRARRTSWRRWASPVRTSAGRRRASAGSS